MAVTNRKLPVFDQQTIDRFWSWITRGDTDECWLWTSGHDSDGYGIFSAACPRKKSFRAHRLAYFFSHRADPVGKMVCHSCDTPSCCNPAHLFLGTAQDNQNDCKAKGRTARGDAHMSRTKPETLARGERHGLHKLDADKVREIRRLYDSGTRSQQSLADSYGVNQYAISRIVRRIAWKHVN